MPTPTKAVNALEEAVRALVQKNHVDKIKFKNYYTMHAGLGATTGAAVGAATGGVSAGMAEHPEDESPETKKKRIYAGILGGAGKGALVGFGGGLLTGHNAMNTRRATALEAGTGDIMQKIKSLHHAELAQTGGLTEARQALLAKTLEIPEHLRPEWVKAIEGTDFLNKAHIDKQIAKVKDADSYKAKALEMMKPTIEKQFKEPVELNAFDELGKQGGCANLSQLCAKLAHTEAGAIFDKMVEETKKQHEASSSVLFNSLKTSNTSPKVIKAHSVLSPLDGRKKATSNKAMQALPKMAETDDEYLRQIYKNPAIVPQRERDEAIQWIHNHPEARVKQAGAPAPAANISVNTSVPAHAAAPVDPKLSIAPEARGQGPRIMQRLINEPGKVLPQVKQNMANGAKLELGSAAPATQSIVNGATRAATSLGITGPIPGLLKGLKNPQEAYPYLEANWGKGKPLEGVQNNSQPFNPALPPGAQPVDPRTLVQGAA